MDPLVIFLLSVIVLLVATLAFLAWLCSARQKEINRLRQALEEADMNPVPTETPASSEDRLTQREKEVARLCCEGLLSKEIADRLDISQRTVETHKNNIFHKLGINTTAELKKYYLCSHDH